jgi:hypothetical protein
MKNDQELDVLIDMYILPAVKAIAKKMEDDLLSSYDSFIAKTYKCTKCEFTTHATTPKGLIAAIKRHRKKEPTHARLTRCDS